MVLWFSRYYNYSKWLCGSLSTNRDAKKRFDIFTKPVKNSSLFQKEKERKAKSEEGEEEENRGEENFWFLNWFFKKKSEEKRESS